MAFRRYIFRKDDQSQTDLSVNADSEQHILELVDKSARGDSKAFGRIYDLFIDRIYRYVFYHVKDKMVAEDITQQVFIRAWESIGSFEWKGKQFSSWLYAIAHNHTVDYYRSCQREIKLKERIIADQETGTEHNEGQSDTREELQAALSCLSPDQREIIILKFIEGLDNRQISEIMTKNEVAIRVAQMRALNALRKNFTLDSNK